MRRKADSRKKMKKIYTRRKAYTRRKTDMRREVRLVIVEDIEDTAEMYKGRRIG